MAMKRKRSSKAGDDQEPPLKRSTDHHARRPAPDAFPARHPVLQQFYPEVLTLRAYVLSKLKNKPRRRRRLFDAVDSTFAQFLDSTIVGSGLPNARPISRQARAQDFISFSQQLSGSTAKSTNTSLVSSQNEYNEIVKGPHWCQLLSLLGKDGDQFMADLLLECGIFNPLADSDNLTQICGKDVLSKDDVYVLNRCRDLHDGKQTQYVMHYIFPKQYGLHNAFVSQTDSRETTHAFKDYTLREKEILSKCRQSERNTVSDPASSDDLKCLPLPKRLRGRPFELVAKFRRFHARCSYVELLRHYCPFPVHMDLRNHMGELGQVSFLHYATPASQVSAFCRSAVVKVIPRELWGDGHTADHNRMRVLSYIDHFIKARKYESATLHDVLDGIKIHEIWWLVPLSISPNSKLSLTDFQKRKEIFMEFLYYVFDSFLIPLIRSNFYVTESNVNRNVLFYFRHDVWRSLAEPSLSQLRLSMFDEIKTDKALKILERRSLPYSHIRLLPKQNGIRPIANLRRRIQRHQYGKTVLGPSINSIMKPVFNVVKFEKDAHQDNAGSSLFSVDEMFPRLRQFRDRLNVPAHSGNALYFAKVDVRSCFDSIPQQKIMAFMEGLITANDYRTARYAEIKALFTGNTTSGKDSSTNISRKFISHGYNGDDFFDLQHILNDGLSESKAKTVFVDSVVQKVETRDNVLNLLSEHVERNIVKVGKKYYRQKYGIPQGSILSSLLCNLFYAQLEKENLSFTGDSDCLLLRMIDDFLLISTNQAKAHHFLQIMHDGLPDFGVSVKSEKSLTNFPAAVNGFPITTLPQDSPFPYCGSLIDPTSLNITKDRARIRALGPISNTLTVEFSKHPGHAFQRKTLNALRIQMHAMFLDTTYNALSTVLESLYQTYRETAQKCFAYIKSLPVTKRPGLGVLVKTIEDVMALSWALMSRRGRRKGQWAQYECAVKRKSAEWLGYTAFSTVFGQKQTRYQLFLAWLAQGIAKARLSAKESRLLTSVISK
ncbi:MAG: hypothetical protein Q9165_002029 [Trypethelium subeluteriae]